MIGALPRFFPRVVADAVFFAVPVAVVERFALVFVTARAAAPAFARRTLPRSCTLSASRVTSRAGLSSRTPRKIGWRSFPSAVHSPNFTSTTIFGVTQCAFSFVFTFSEKGDDARSSGASLRYMSRSPSLVKPPPVCPT